MGWLDFLSALTRLAGPWTFWQSVRSTCPVHPFREPYQARGWGARLAVEPWEFLCVIDCTLIHKQIKDLVPFFTEICDLFHNTYIND
jgi:hypothetical protein